MARSRVASYMRPCYGSTWAPEARTRLLTLPVGYGDGYPRGVARRGPAEVIVLEADPSGGSLAGWLGTPATPTLASAVAAASSGVRTVGDTIDSVVQRSRSGIRFVAAPVRSLPARRAIAEADATIVPELASRRHVVTLADLGRPSGDPPHLLHRASVTVVVHRQSPASAEAESVRLERLLEQVEGVRGPVVLAVIGREPFDPGEIVQFQVRWGPVYDPEMILEHGIVHLLRHRRQLERWRAER